MGQGWQRSVWGQGQGTRLEEWVSRTESCTGTLLEVNSFYSWRRGMTALRDVSPEVARLEAIQSEHHSHIQQTIVLFFIHQFGCGSVSLRIGWGDTNGTIFHIQG